MQPFKALILAAQLPNDELTAIAGAAAPHALRVGNQPLASFAVAAAHAAGIDDIAIVVCSSNVEAVQSAVAGMSSREPVWILTPTPLGMAGSIVAAAEFLDGARYLVHSGDAIVLEPLAAQLLAGPDAVLLTSADGPAEERSLHAVDRSFSEDGLAGAHIFGPRMLAVAADAQPDTGAASLATALSRAGGDVRTSAVRGSWTYRGTVDHMLEANRMVLDELPGDRADQQSPDVRIEGRVLVHPSASLERTGVRGPAVIGAGAVLRDAFIGPYSSIGENVLIEGAEIEHSIVLAGAKIRHPGRRLEASLVGEGATVARDFAICSSLRVRVGERTEVRLT